MECRLETITPKKATQLLKLNTKNRPISMSAVEKLSNAIKRGEWKLNGDTIKLNGDVLIDGQHRLNAIIKSGVACQAYIVRGVQSDAFDTLDQGRRRTVGHMFARDGEKYYSHLATACRFLYYYENGLMRSGGVGADFTPTIARHVLDSHRGIRESVSFVSALYIQELLSIGVAAGVHWLCSQKDDPEASAFFSRLGTGEDINRSMPVYVLRERLRKNRSQQAKVRQYVLAAWCVKAWNATRANAKLGTLKWIEDEDFPTVK